MRGLEVLLRVRRVAEDKALEALSTAKGVHEQARMEEAVLQARAEEAKQALRDLETAGFGVRRSLQHRRYLNAVRAHRGRCRQRTTEAWAAVEAKKREYEEKRNRREAVEELIRRRRDQLEKDQERRRERRLGDLAQNVWVRAAEGEA
jgi:flagellar export protein FliJ